MSTSVPSIASDAAPPPGVVSALRDIQTPVRDRLDAVTREMQRLLTADAPLLAQVGGHLLAMKGKMFRPTLVLLASDTDGQAEAHAVTMAAVVEMTHLATLVHDDAVDHSVLRRGMPTINALFSHQISVIMGDFLYSVALTTISSFDDLRPLRILVDASTQMTVGELRQLSVTEPLQFSEADYELLIRSKTASLIGAACQIGALCGAPRHLDALTRFGDALGMAFQIADDLIDYTETAETTGKPTGLDLREHKVTLPLIAALPRLSPAARARVDALFASSEPEDAQVADVIGIVTEAGGLEYARARGQAFAAQAEAALVTLPPTPARDSLMATISYVMDRHA